MNKAKVGDIYPHGNGVCKIVLPYKQNGKVVGEWSVRFVPGNGLNEQDRATAYCLKLCEVAGVKIGDLVEMDAPDYCVDRTEALFSQAMVDCSA